MKNQVIKDWAHWSLGKLNFLNYWRLKTVSRNALGSRRSDGKLWVHLGCGKHYIPGMINMDINPFTKSDIWLDLRSKLPFDTDSVDAIYCCHTLEHFYENDVRMILSECLRVLKKKRGIRIVTPDLRKAVEAYLSQDFEHFSDFPDKRRSIGGRCANYLLCRDQHRLIFDFSFWNEILEDQGFGQIAEFKPHESAIFSKTELGGFEYEKPDRHHSVFVEAFKK